MIRTVGLHVGVVYLDTEAAVGSQRFKQPIIRCAATDGCVAFGIGLRTVRVISTG